MLKPDEGFQEYEVPSLGNLRDLTIIFHREAVALQFSSERYFPNVCHFEIVTNVSAPVKIPITIISGGVFSSVQSVNGIEFAKSESGNSDIYEYNVGNVSLSSPVPVMLSFQNPNPIHVIFSVRKASLPIADMCYSIGLQGIDFDKLFPVIMCETGDNSTRFNAFHSKQILAFPDMFCEDSSSSHLFYYADGEGGDAIVHFVLPPQAAATLGFLFVNYSLGLDELVIEMDSEFQRKKYSLGYNGVKGTLLTMYQVEQNQLTMGRKNRIDIFGHSTYSFPVSIDSVHSSSAAISAHLASEDAASNNGFDKKENFVYFGSSEDSTRRKGFLIGYASSPFYSCLHPTSPFGLWACVISIMASSLNDSEEDSIWHSFGINPPVMREGAAVEIPDIFESNSRVKELTNAAMEVRDNCFAKKYESAFASISKFRQLWLENLPSGFSLPDLTVLFRSTFLYFADFHI